MARAIMLQGTGTNVGKSLLVAGLCRHLARSGLRVRPFKPQNMSNNAAVTADGGEIGRAQALQARACGVEPMVDMNPVLLKPEAETGSQVVVQGRRLATVRARDYARLKPTLLAACLESFARVAEGADLVVVEGAGSPAEINLRAGDIANMGFAEAAGLPVVLVGDIDRGGVIAQLVGTAAVLEPADRERIVAFVVNKFRGDVTLFADGVKAVAARTGWAPLGVVPWFAAAGRLPAEDVMDLRATPRAGGLRVAVPRLPRIANFDDLDPLAAEPGVSLDLVEPGRPLPVCDVVILPGSKSTIADLAAFRAEGWDVDLAAHVRRGGPVLGLCGGYQMLGRWIADPDGIEGPARRVTGLGHLDVETVLGPRKRLARCALRHPRLGRGGRGIRDTSWPDRGPGRGARLARGGRAGGRRGVVGRVRAGLLPPRPLRLRWLPVGLDRRAWRRHLRARLRGRGRRHARRPCRPPRVLPRPRRARRPRDGAGHFRETTCVLGRRDAPAGDAPCAASPPSSPSASRPPPSPPPAATTPRASSAGSASSPRRRRRPGSARGASRRLRARAIRRGRSGRTATRPACATRSTTSSASASARSMPSRRRRAGTATGTQRSSRPSRARYGVPAGILLAIWGMETGFGRTMGSVPVVSSISTVAYDCRRSDFFTPHAVAALAMVDRGMLSPDQIGAFHGELGHTQFLPANALRYGADGDGDGRVDFYDVADAMTSTANYLREKGWRPGEGYGGGERELPRPQRMERRDRLPAGDRAGRGAHLSRGVRAAGLEPARPTAARF